jgi:multiple sugar transport system permease protein
MGKKKKLLREAIFYVVTVLVILFFLFPIFYMFITSIKSPLDAYAIPPKLLNFIPTTTNWINIFTQKPIFHYMYNSIVVAFGTTLVSMVFGSLAAYSLARFQIKHANKISLFVLSIRMLPPFAAVIPIFLIMKRFELLDTRFGLIIAHTTFNLPFVVWMMREFIISLPLEIEEAGMMDGLTRFMAFYKLLLPLLKPSLTAVSIFCVIFSWSEFLFALLLTQTEAKTMPVGIAELSWQQASAAGTAIIIPVLLLAIGVQKYLIRGLTFGAIKS